MTQPTPALVRKEATRTFSKRITIANLAVLAGIAGYGLWTQSPYSAEVLTAYGMWSFGGIAMYMAVGLGDYRTAKGIPGVMDLLTLLVSSRSRGRHGGGYVPHTSDGLD